MSRARSWSLRRRIGALFAALSIAPVLVSTAVGIFYLERSVHRELHTLVREEIEEARTFLSECADPLSSFEQHALTLARHHPDVDMAWRLRRGEAQRDYGQRRLVGHLDEAAPPANHHAVQELAGERLAIGMRLDELHVTLLLDGSRWLRHVRQYWWIGGATVALGVLLSLLAARFVSNRYGALLAGITARLGEGRHDHDERLPAELHGIADQLDQMLHDVRKRADDARLFTTGLAHELRSPIQNLVGEAEVALMRPRSDEQYRALLHRQIDELRDFARAVDNLLFLCSVGEPARRGCRELFDLASEAELRLDGEYTHASRRGVTVDVDAAGDCRMHGDREAVMRAVRNIVHNAIKWTPRDGDVRVAIDGRGEALVVEVEDGGPGVPPADRERMFTPFVQGPAPQGERTGFGLGLAITKSVAEQHGGDVAIADGANGGALLRLTLQRGRVTKGETAAASA